MLTLQVDGIRISQLLRCDIDLLVGDGREEGNHVVVPVVANWRHLVRVGTVGRSEPCHPLVEDGVGESVEHLRDEEADTTRVTTETVALRARRAKVTSHHEDGVVGCRVRQSAGSVQHGVDQVVKVVDRRVQFSVWLLIAFKSISVIRKANLEELRESKGKQSVQSQSGINVGSTILNELCLKLKEELVKYGGLSKSLIPRQLLMSFMVGRDMFPPPINPL